MLFSDFTDKIVNFICSKIEKDQVTKEVIEFTKIILDIHSAFEHNKPQFNSLIFKCEDGSEHKIDINNE